MRTVLLVACLLLAGCSGGQAAEVATELAQGKGAIAGLLVDDRFRPLELTEAPQDEYQHAGFILVQEIGLRVATDANGEFTVLDLEPGTYTLRPSVEGHESLAQSVRVEEGLFSEVTVVIERVVSAGHETVLVQEDSLLLTCNFQALDARYSPGKLCFGDVSQDGDNGWIAYNFTEFGQVVAIVTEVEFSREDDWELWFTPAGNIVSQMYARPAAYDASYFRYQARAGDEGRFGALPMDPMDLWVWVQTAEAGQQEIDEITGLPVGVGFSFQSVVRVVTSAFLEEPPGFDEYALLR